MERSAVLSPVVNQPICHEDDVFSATDGTISNNASSNRQNRLNKKA